MQGKQQQNESKYSAKLIIIKYWNLYIQSSKLMLWFEFLFLVSSNSKQLTTRLTK